MNYTEFSFIDAGSTAGLSHRKPEAFRTSSDTRGAQDNDKRNAVYTDYHNNNRGYYTDNNNSNNSLLFTCLINNRKANYRHSTDKKTNMQQEKQY